MNLENLKKKLSGNKEKMVEISIFSICILSVILFILSIVIFIYYKDAKKEIAQLKEDKVLLNDEINLLSEEVTSLNLEIEELNRVHEEELSFKVEIAKEAEYNSVIEQITSTTSITNIDDLCDQYNIAYNQAREYEEKIKELNTVIEDLVTKMEIYEAYDYCFFDSEGKRNDLTADDIELLTELTSSEYCDDVDMYLAWILVESQGYAKAKNPNSTAKGLPQFLDGTSKNVYSKLDYEDAWYPEIVFKKDVALNMMVRYVNDLINDYKGDLNKAINSYRGLHDGPYLAAINRNLANKGKSIDSIAMNTYSRYTAIKEMENIAVG